MGFEHALAERRDLLRRITRTKDRQHLPQLHRRIKMPKVPKIYIEHPKVKHELRDTIEFFSIEEQEAIYLYCFSDMPVCEIMKKTELSQTHVVGVLILYSERLKFKLRVFKKAMPYNASDLLPIGEMYS